MNSLTPLFAATLFALGLSNAAAADRSDANARSAAAPTVVLVHGAFADGSSWHKVIPLLQAEGLKVVSVQNPLSSLADDVAFAKRAIDAQPGRWCWSATPGAAR